jgi:hypothetical protein
MRYGCFRGCPWLLPGLPFPLPVPLPSSLGSLVALAPPAGGVDGEAVAGGAVPVAAGEDG